MSPLVSVVIPTYNRAHDLERALRSVLVQTHTNWEVLLVDNYSTDNTKDVVKGLADPRIKLLSIHNHGVIGVSRNIGIKRAVGKYVAFLDSDDWWTPRKLETSLSYLEAGADIVYHDLFVVKSARQKVFRGSGCVRRLRNPAFDDLFVGGNALLNSSVVVRKCILDAIGGLPEEISWITMEDYAAWLKIAKVTERFELIPKTLGYYWAGGGNTGTPETTIKCLNAFEDVFAKTIQHRQMDARFWWLNYSKGRAYYRLGAYAMAKRTLAKVRWRKLPLSVAAKILWMRVAICFSHSGDSCLVDK